MVVVAGDLSAREALYIVPFDKLTAKETDMTLSSAYYEDTLLLKGNAELSRKSLSSVYQMSKGDQQGPWEFD